MTALLGSDEATTKLYRELLLRVFQENRRSNQNPDGLFFYYFDDRQNDMHQSYILEVLERIGRQTILVDCAGLTGLKIYRSASETDGNTRVAYSALEELLLKKNVAVVFKDISRSKVPSPVEFVRSLLKIVDDAHFQGYRPISDLIFIDSASFLQKGWPSIAQYTRQIGPMNIFENRISAVSDSTPFAIQ